MGDEHFSSGFFEPDHEIEKDWVQAVQGGDKKTFKLIFETYYHPLTRFAYRYLKSEPEAESAVQDVFLWIWEKRETWSVEGKLKTYLFRAVKYQCLDLIRRQDVRKKYIRELAESQEQVQPPNIHGAGFDEEKFRKLTKEAIEDLPERARIIYKLSRVEGLTYSEIADVLEISPKTVESQMSRALNILRTRLSNYLGLLFAVKKMVDSLF